MLVYYDGILILTSNRVGLSDEAFNSRIQLALHYEPLRKSQRKQIWYNFIARLRNFQATSVDFDDLYSRLDELAEHEMTGRQIKNVVTTIRQLAMYRRKSMDFAALTKLINVSDKFDKYLKSINKGLLDEVIAREDRIR